MNWKVKLACAVFFIACCTGLWLYYSELGVEKFVFPGTFKTNLKAGDSYIVWYFWQWPTRNVSTPMFTPLKLKVTTSEGLPIPVNLYTHPTPGSGGLFNEGAIAGELAVASTGQFCVSGTQNCVVALVPYGKTYSLIDAESFFGNADDFNFHEPEPTNNQ